MDFFPISVVIPSRNRSSEIPKIVRLIQSQSYPAHLLEIIIVDNASTDRTADICQELIRESNIPIRYIYEPRKGVTYARNRGMAEARYDYAAIIDDDCLIGEDWLCELVKGFQLHPDVVAVGGLVYIAWEVPRPKWFGFQLEPYYGSTDFLGDEMRLINDKERVVEFNLILRKDAWHQAGGFYGMEIFSGTHLAAGEIYPLLIQFRKRNWKIGYVPKASAGHKVSNRIKFSWLLRRFYFQGVINALFQNKLDDNQRENFLRLTLQRILGMVKEILVLCKFLIRMDLHSSVYHFLNLFSYLGHMITDIRIGFGDYQTVKKEIVSL